MHFFYNGILCYGMWFEWYSMIYLSNAIRCVWYAMRNWNERPNNIAWYDMPCYGIWTKNASTYRRGTLLYVEAFLFKKVFEKK